MRDAKREQRLLVMHNMKDAQEIVDYCLANFISCEPSTVHAYLECGSGTFVSVIFFCTNKEWDRIHKHYNLVKIRHSPWAYRFR